MTTLHDNSVPNRARPHRTRSRYRRPSSRSPAPSPRRVRPGRARQLRAPGVGSSVTFNAAFASRSCVTPQPAQVLPDLQRLPAGPQPAARTQLRAGEPAADLHHLPVAPFGFLLQQSNQGGPSRIVHRLRQPGAGQPGHCKVFDVHRLVIADQSQRQFVMRIQPSLPHPAMQDRDPPDGPLTVVRPARLAGKSTLRPGQCPGLPAQVPWVLDHLAGGQRGQPCQAEVDPDIVPACR